MTQRRTSFLVVALLAWSAAVSSSAEPTADVSGFMSAFENADADQRRTLLYEFTQGVRRGEIAIEDTEAEPLMRFMADLALGSHPQRIQSKAMDFMRTHAHPVVADPLVEAMARNDDGNPATLPRGTGILARLRDERALPPLLAYIETVHPEAHRFQATLDMLVDIGNADAIPALTRIAGDPTLWDRVANRMEERELERGREPDSVRIDARTRKEVSSIRAMISRAVRDIGLIADERMKCPFDVDDHVIAALKRNGFVVVPEQKNELYEYYGEEYPFVTVDTVYHTYVVLIRAAVDELERFSLKERVAGLSVGMVDACLRLAAARERKTDREAALDAAAFFAVPAVLTDGMKLGDRRLPEAQRDAVTDEVCRIRAAAGVSTSAILDYKEDYSEYRRRGRFSRDDTDRGYFQAVTWLGRGIFAAESRDATRRALMVLLAFAENPSLKRTWVELDEVLTLLAGASDDLDILDYMRIAETVSGRRGLAAVESVLSSSPKFGRFREDLRAAAAPRVNTRYLSMAEQPAWRTRTKGLRILGQRYARDAELFQNLMDGDTWPPSGLHVAAELLGSGRAAAILAERPAGPAAMPAPAALETESLMEGYFRCFETVFEPDACAPAFIRSPAWEEKMINSALGAWAETRHAAAPYLKAAHVYAGLSAMTDRFHGYVEPYPEFYARLSEHAGRLEALLERCGLFDRIAEDVFDIESRLDADYGPPNKHGHRERKSDEKWEVKYERELATKRLDRDMLSRFREMLAHLEAIARRELAGQPQTIADGVFLKSVGRRMQSLCFNRSSMLKAEEPMSRITDVAVEYQSGQCLQAGVGRPLALYVAVPDGDRTFVCRGSIYSYYEFTWPLADRIDDTAWAVAADRLGTLGFEPWIMTRPGLGLVQPLSRDDLLALKAVIDEQPQNAFKGGKPWLSRRRYGDPPPAYGAMIDAGNRDVLLEIVRNPDAKDSAVLLALDNLIDFVDAPDVIAYFKETADTYIDGTDRPRNIFSNLARLYYSIIALGKARDVETLARVEEMVLSERARARDYHHDLYDKISTMADLSIVMAGR